MSDGSCCEGGKCSAGSIVPPPPPPPLLDGSADDAAASGAGGGLTHCVDSAGFQKAVEAAGGMLVVVDAYADWCGPCRMIAPVFEELSRSPEYAHIKFIKLDTERAPAVAKQLKIKVMPTFVFLKHGEQVGYVLGASEKSLRQGLDADGKVGLCNQLCVVS